MKKRRKETQTLSPEHVLRILESARRPVGIDEFESIFRTGKPGRRELLRILSEQISRGRVTELKGKRYGLTKEMDLVTGTLWCTRSGNGFVVPDSPERKDVFVSSRNFNYAVHGDHVTVRLDHYSRGKPEGKVIRIVERHSNKIIGFTKLCDNKVYVTPEDYRYNTEYTVVKPRANLGDGRLVVAEVTAFPGDTVEPRCRITKVLGDLTGISSIGKFIEYKHSLSNRFTRPVEQEARDAVSELTASGREGPARSQVRHHRRATCPRLR